MSRLFYHVMQDNAGNLLFDVSGTMRLAGTGTLATIYGDAALTVPIANPMTCHPSFGSFKCYLGAGSYDFYMAKSGYTFETLTGVQGWGTMALQNANAVAITGGSAALSNAVLSTATLATMGVHTGPVGNVAVAILHNKAGGEQGMAMGPGVGQGDTGALEISFLNAAGVIVGGISSTATTTSFITTSDVRLKKDVQPLTGALDVVQALRPISHRWKADDSPGVGFLAHEVAAHVPGVITGEAGAVHPDGTINPQQIDYSKLVPFLVGAIQTLAARVAVLEDALGA